MTMRMTLFIMIMLSICKKKAKEGEWCDVYRAWDRLVSIILLQALPFSVFFRLFSLVVRPPPRGGGVRTVPGYDP